jgi:hypothetical protein
LVKFLNGEFEQFTKSFFTVNEDSHVIFTLIGKHSLYEITYDKKHGPITSQNKNFESSSYEIKYDNRIKLEIFEDSKKKQN